MASIGKLRERLTIQTARPLAIEIQALSWAGGVVSATTRTAHGYSTGDYATIAGATPSGYNGKVRVTVTGASVFAYSVTGPLATPATGIITATYAGDTHGGKSGLTWRTLTTIPAEFVPLRTFERLQRLAVEDGLACQFRVRARADLAAGLRAVWTARWPAGVGDRTLLVKGVEPDDARRAYMMLLCEEVTL